MNENSCGKREIVIMRNDQAVNVLTPFYTLHGCNFMIGEFAGNSMYKFSVIIKPDI